MWICCASTWVWECAGGCKKENNRKSKIDSNTRTEYFRSFCLYTLHIQYTRYNGMGSTTTYNNSICQDIDTILIARCVDTIAVQPTGRICWWICTKLHGQMQWRSGIRNRCMISHTNGWRTCNLFPHIQYHNMYDKYIYICIYAVCGYTPV